MNKKRSVWNRLVPIILVLVMLLSAFPTISLAIGEPVEVRLSDDSPITLSHITGGFVDDLPFPFFLAKVPAGTTELKLSATNDATSVSHPTKGNPVVNIPMGGWAIVELAAYAVFGDDDLSGIFTDDLLPALSPLMSLDHYYILNGGSDEFQIIVEISDESGGDLGDDPGGDPPPTTGQYVNGELTVNYFANYGGTVTADDSGMFTTAATAAGYVIDTICIDGIPLSGTDDPIGKTGDTYAFADGATGTHSVVATFAYTLSFNSPANGTLSVSRGGTPLTSGVIVRGGEILTITATPNDGYELDDMALVGLNSNGDGTYTVFGKAAPSINASYKQTQAETVAPPMINTHPSNVSYTVGATALPLSVNAHIHGSSNGVLSYQWYSSTDNSSASKGDDSLVGINSAEYTPTISALGTSYYYVVVTNTFNSETASVTSEVAYVTVNEPSETAAYPTINAQPVGGTYELNAEATLSVAASISDSGTLSYQWYRNGSPDTVVNDASEAVPIGTNSATCIADTDIAGFNQYYFVVITNTLNDSTRSQTSTAVRVVVTAPSAGWSTKTDITIANEAELFAFADEVISGNPFTNLTVTLASDITLTKQWRPIGTFYSKFKGTFDGGGHTISGLNVYNDTFDMRTRWLGLFGYTELATIKDVTVIGTITAVEGSVGKGSSDTPYVGGIVSFANGGSVSGCVSRVTIDVVRGTTGGIAGICGDVSNCLNYGDINVRKGNSTIGGIVADGGNVTQSGNYGSITTIGESYGYVDSGSGSQITNYPANSQVGGVVGTATSGTVENCFNKGDLSGWMEYAGGIVGFLNGGYGGYTYMLTVRDCYSTGAISQTARNNIGSRMAHVGGIVGAVMSYGTDKIGTFTNCYNIGTLSNTADVNHGEINPFYCYNGAGTNKDRVTESNLYALGTSPTAEQLGSAFKADTNGANGGNPLLTWESGDVSDDVYSVTFVTTPTNTAVKVYTDAARENEVTANVGAYALRAGTYYYTATASGYISDSGSFTVVNAGRAVPITLYAVANVTFTVTPANATFALTDALKRPVTPVSSNNGSIVFELFAGRVYTYTVTASGYNGITREFSASTDSIAVALTVSSQSEQNTTVKGGDTIGTGGVYNLGRNTGSVQGVITITTPQAVTLVGTGVSAGDAYENLYIKYVTDKANLTIRDLYISNTVGTTNMIDFTGESNILNFRGTNILDMNTGATGYAMIHVNQNTGLTISGVSDSDNLYIYKREQGAGIGGNGGAGGGEGQPAETNGTITIVRGNFFMKNSKQGALIGAGAQAGTQKPGAITIKGGVLNLIAISRGSAIGGSAGSGGASSGSDVYMHGGTLNIHIDWSGSAIGGGGFDGGNDSDGGVLHYYGGSIRTYIGENAVGQWNSFGVTKAGVNDAVITAKTVNGDSNEPVYRLVFNTSTISGSSFNVSVDGSNIYSGRLHQYAYINETLPKDNQIDINYTMDNWTSLNDPNLYLYLTGKDHTLSVNSKTFTVEWDDATKTFTVKDSAGNVISAGSGETPTAPKSDVVITPEVVADSGGKATANVTADDIADAIDSAQSQKVNTIIIAPDVTGDASNITVTLPTKSAQDLSDANIILLIQTELGEIAIPADVLKEAIAGAGSNATLSISIETATLGATKVVISVGGKIIESLNNPIRVKLPVPDSLKVPLAATPGLSGILSPHLVVYLNGADGDKIIQKSLIINNTAYFLLKGTAEVTIADNAKTFSDVLTSHWFYNEVSYAASHELFLGVSETEFAPNMPMTRAMLVTVLWRLESNPASAAAAFRDVADGQWYTEAIAWANANGIVNGIGDNEFGPNGDVTREQLATMLYRYAKYLGMDTSATGDLSIFTDGGKTSDWAADAMKWAVGSGIIAGTSSTTIDPQGTATRAQVATMLTRMIAIMVR